MRISFVHPKRREEGRRIDARLERDGHSKAKSEVRWSRGIGPRPAPTRSPR